MKVRSDQLTFHVEIIREDDNKSYYVVVPALPGCFSQGKTIQQAKKNIAEAIALHIRALRKSGQSVNESESYQTIVQVSA